MNFDMKVRRVLGDNVVDTLLCEVDEGRINEQHAEVIAQKLHPTILNVTNENGAIKWTEGPSEKSCQTGIR